MNSFVHEEENYRGGFVLYLLCYLFSEEDRSYILWMKIICCNIKLCFCFVYYYIISINPNLLDI